MYVYFTGVLLILKFYKIYMRRFAQISTIYIFWKIASMVVFHIFEIVQRVANQVKHHIWNFGLK